jgi:vacuolar-type H+-ATPase subunit E/Vma4
MASRNIIEKLEKRGMNESAIKKFIGSIIKAYKEKKLDKLTNDPEYQKILKKYNIKPVSYGKDKSLDDLHKALKAVK